jgi:hypothetical protein
MVSLSKSEIISRGKYNEALSAILPPASIIATSPSSCVTPVWHENEKRNLVHDIWKIRTADEKMVMKPNRYIRFDVSIDFPGAKLNEARWLHDCYTKKLLCLHILGDAVADAGAGYATTILASFDWMLRWRNSMSLRSFSELTLLHFEQYCIDGSTTDILNLVPVVERLDILLEDETFTLPFYVHGRARRMKWNALASTLGVGRANLTRSKLFREALERRLPILLDRSGVRPENVRLYSDTSAPKESEELISLDQRVMAWQFLERLTASGKLQHDPLSFIVPFKNLPQAIGKEKRMSARTTTLLPHDMVRVLELALKWVLDYSGFLLDVLRRRAEFDPGGKRTRRYWRELAELTAEIDKMTPAGFAPLGLASSSAAALNDGRLPLSFAVKYLFVACSIVVGCFGARRTNETSSLKYGCIRGSNGLYFLSIYIEKTLQDADEIPVPTVVRAAISVLDSLSSDYRKENDSEFLFRFSKAFADGRQLDTDTSFNNNLVEFVTLGGLPPPAGSLVWRLHYHMFRKGFAVFFYHGNLWGGFDGANRMLRHTSDGMTRIYTDDEDIGQLAWLRLEVIRLTNIAVADRSEQEKRDFDDIKELLKLRKARKSDWNEVRQEFFVSTMMATFDGIERPVGKGAATMLDELKEMELRAHFRIQYAPVPTNGQEEARNNVLEQVQKAAVDHFMEPIPGGFGYCLYKRGSSDQAALANCLKDKAAARRPWSEYRESGIDTRPDYAFSGIHPCLDCPFFAAMNRNQEMLKHTETELASQVSKAATPALKVGAQQYVDDVRKLVKGLGRAVDGKQRFVE